MARIWRCPKLYNQIGINVSSIESYYQVGRLPFCTLKNSLGQRRNSATFVRHNPELLTRQAPREDGRLLSTLPTSSLLRSLIVLSTATLPRSILLRLIKVTKKHAERLESSKILQWLVRTTFYKHFCIGSHRDEILSNSSSLRQMGVSGIVLTYAREAATSTSLNKPTLLTDSNEDLNNWVASNFETIDMTTPGDYIALRVTGAGPTVVSLLERYTQAMKTTTSSTLEATLVEEHAILTAAIRRICAHAYSHSTRILIDAESSRYQPAIDAIALSLMPEFNKSAERATILNTYQLYLKGNIDKIKQHIQHSIDHKYLLGLKLVRGAYMYVEGERPLVNDTKAETDRAYDEAVKYLLSGRIGETREEDATTLSQNGQNKELIAKVDVVLATHNTESVQKALGQYNEMLAKDSVETNARIRGLCFAQLMGMADELSLDLAKRVGHASSGIRTGNIDNTAASTMLSAESNKDSGRAVRTETRMSSFPKLGIYKYTVWGTLSDCLLYMLRRAEENSDSVARSRKTVRVVIKELWTRLFTFGR